MVAHPKEKAPIDRYVIIVSIIMIILQGGNLVGVALNREKSLDNEKKIEFIGRDYAPMWFVQALQSNEDYRTQELVAVFGGDTQKAKEISVKYEAFRESMISQMIRFKGGITNITRTAKSDKSPGGTK